MQGVIKPVELISSYKDFSCVNIMKHIYIPSWLRVEVVQLRKTFF